MSQREVNMELASEKAGDADSNKEDYVHIRAKRGQATNNHSLAERVIIEQHDLQCRSFDFLVHSS
jgi:hypothetical protein